MIKWLSCLPNKIGYINSSILDTVSGSSNTLPSLKFLELMVHKLVGGSSDPPPSPQTSLWGAKGLDQEGSIWNDFAGFQGPLKPDFRSDLSLAKVFALDMRKLVKPIELDETISFALFSSEV